MVRRYVLLGLLGGSFLLSACSGNHNATQAGPNDRAACQALDLIYATNGANPINVTQAGTWSTLGLATENRQLRTSAQLLVAAAHSGNQAKVLTEFGIAGGICTTMGVGPGPGFVANTGT